MCAPVWGVVGARLCSGWIGKGVESGTSHLAILWLCLLPGVQWPGEVSGAVGGHSLHSPSGMAQGLWTVMLAAQGLCILVSLPLPESAARWVVLISWRAQGTGSCQVCGRGTRWSAGHADVPFLFSGTEP